MEKTFLCCSIDYTTVAFAFTDTSDFVLTEITRTPRTTTMPTSMPPRTPALPSHQSSFEDRRDFLNNCAFHDPEKFESFLSVTQENQNTCNVCSRPSGISTLPWLPYSAMIAALLLPLTLDWHCPEPVMLPSPAISLSCYEPLPFNRYRRTHEHCEKKSEVEESSFIWSYLC